MAPRFNPFHPDIDVTPLCCVKLLSYNINKQLSTCPNIFRDFGRYTANLFSNCTLMQLFLPKKFSDIM